MCILHGMSLLRCKLDLIATRAPFRYTPRHSTQLKKEQFRRSYLTGDSSASHMAGVGCGLWLCGRQGWQQCESLARSYEGALTRLEALLQSWYGVPWPRCRDWSPYPSVRGRWVRAKAQGDHVSTDFSDAHGYRFLPCTCIVTPPHLPTFMLRVKNVVYQTSSGSDLASWSLWRHHLAAAVFFSFNVSVLMAKLVPFWSQRDEVVASYQQALVQSGRSVWPMEAPHTSVICLPSDVAIYRQRDVVRRRSRCPCGLGFVPM
jgi:hypothetical protein